MRLNSGHVIGSISDAAFNFIVHDPSGIIDVSSPMSFRSRRRTKRIISVSEWCVLKTGCVRNGDVRARFRGYSSGGAKPPSPGLRRSTKAPPHTKGAAGPGPSGPAGGAYVVPFDPARAFGPPTTPAQNGTRGAATTCS